MSDSFFKNDLESEEASLEESVEGQDKKLFSKINNRFSDDKKNAKIIIFVGVLALVLGAWHLLSEVKNAFVFSPLVLEDKTDVIDGLNRIKDTDGDGISDYDEKYIYSTSPYLADTDSDGISDYDEIMAGQAPLCVGNTCADNLEENFNSESSEVENGKLMNLEELKDYLVEAGYPESEVNKLSEEDLKLIYAEVEKSVGNEEYTYSDIETDQSASGESPSAEQLEQLQNLPIEQIKELLVQGGATMEQLNSISEGELRGLYLEALKSL
jgi:hypothetical protein